MKSGMGCVLPAGEASPLGYPTPHRDVMLPTLDIGNWFHIHPDYQTPQILSPQLSMWTSSDRLYPVKATWIT